MDLEVFFINLVCYQLETAQSNSNLNLQGESTIQNHQAIHQDTKVYRMTLHENDYK